MRTVAILESKQSLLKFDVQILIESHRASSESDAFQPLKKKFFSEANPEAAKS